MNGWRDIEAAKEYRRQMLWEAAQWRLAHPSLQTQRRTARIHHRTLAWLGYRLFLLGVQLLKRYGKAGLIPYAEIGSED